MSIKSYILSILIAVVFILIFINIPYSTKVSHITENYTYMEPYNITENYTEKIPYNVTENYTEEVPYAGHMYHGYLFEGNPSQITATHILNNVTSYSFNYTGKNNFGDNEYNYTVCAFYCYYYPNITDATIYTDNVTLYREVKGTHTVIKYREVIKTHTVTKYRELEKTHEVNKTVYTNLSLVQRLFGNNTGNNTETNNSNSIWTNIFNILNSTRNNTRNNTLTNST